MPDSVAAEPIAGAAAGFLAGDLVGAGIGAISGSRIGKKLISEEKETVDLGTESHVVLSQKQYQPSDLTVRIGFGPGNQLFAERASAHIRRLIRENRDSNRSK